MAKYFREDEIEEFRECFFFHARQDSRSSERTPGLRRDELKDAMRSLGLSPTLDEVRKYTAKHGGKVLFADFLEVLYEHKKVEQIPDDILEGFRIQDVRNREVIPEKEVRWMLQYFGERLSRYEVEQIFREGKATSSGNVSYREFVQNICRARDRGHEVQPRRQLVPSNYGHQNGFTDFNEPSPDYS